MTEYWQKNKDNYFVRDKTAVWVSRKAADGTYGDWLNLGNIVDQTLTPAIERLNHKSDFKGMDKQDHSIVIGTTLTGKITIDELVRHNLEMLLLSSGRDTLETIVIPRQESAVWTGATVTINGGNAITAILNVRHLSNDDPYTEGVTGDYTVNLATGVLTKTAGTTIGSETVIVEYTVTNTEATKYPILDAGDIEVKMKWVMDGTNVTPRQLMLYFPSVKVSVDGDIPFPKTEIQQAVLNCEILEDEAEGFGYWAEYVQA